MQGDNTSLLLRSIFYVLLIAGLSLLLHLDARLPVSKFTESSLTETAQEVIFLCLTIGFLIHANCFANTATLSRLFSGFFLMCFIREMDYHLEKWSGDGTWQVLVIVVLLAMAYTAWRGRMGLAWQVGNYVRTPGFGLFIAGFSTTFIFSRIIGSGTLWEAMMQDNYDRNIKNVVEEAVELLGDMLLLIAGIEYYFQYRVGRIDAADRRGSKQAGRCHKPND